LAYILALASAVAYGAADFLGGFAARRASALAVVVTSQAAGLVVLLAMLPVLPDTSPSAGDLAWGAAAGLSGGTGVALLYRALAVGTMAVVAPTTAVCAVAIPVFVSMSRGERPGRLTLIGMALAVVAIALVSRPHVGRPHVGVGRVLVLRPATLISRVLESKTRPAPSLPPGVGLALLSGVAIGVFFLALARTSSGAGLWPLVAARVVSVTCFAVAALATRRPLMVPAAALGTVIGAGTVDMIANALYLLATRLGAMSPVVTLSSLYPASTVLLARVVLGERLSMIQKIGITCALVAVMLIVAS
jgi:drug/metabolite transporter (DMT)-like permease